MNDFDAFKQTHENMFPNIGFDEEVIIEHFNIYNAGRVMQKEWDENQIADMIDITRGDQNQLVRNHVLATAILNLRT